MSDVINSIFGRAQNERPSSEGYGYGTAPTGTVEAATPEAETAEDTTEVEDAVDETADVNEADEDSSDDAEDSDDTTGTDEAEDVEDAAVDAVESDDEESDAAVADEAVADEEDDETVADEAVADGEDDESEADADDAVGEETEAAEAGEPEETEEAATRSAAGVRGTTTVADGVVAKIVTRVAAKAEGVYELDEAGTSVEVLGDDATITVALVIEFGHAVKALAEQIRVQVIEAVEQYLGLEVATVDVHVADIHFPDAD
ncbi:Asp23/Gls24 family envelope stress response protein [Amycolatopsis sp. NBC_01488]|uniref:Asp23/Gls24 family envelope stress response protein n=1 Tax=Amycolatopsis sp. NBC_01488 TaxID=2903563 RepID=UPI002E27AB36|nr:Asp23/Gls24 family envelope stress response protein [Amycolatopsis sp. NBC_01488]